MTDFHNAFNYGVFPHECESPACDRIVEFDDEPCCFAHSPDEGSSVVGYSARQKAERQNMGNSLLRAQANQVIN